MTSEIDCCSYKKLSDKNSGFINLEKSGRVATLFIVLVDVFPSCCYLRECHPCMLLIQFKSHLVFQKFAIRDEWQHHTRLVKTKEFFFTGRNLSVLWHSDATPLLLWFFQYFASHNAEMIFFNLLKIQKHKKLLSFFRMCRTIGNETSVAVIEFFNWCFWEIYLLIFLFVFFLIIITCYKTVGFADWSN